MNPGFPKMVLDMMLAALVPGGTRAPAGTSELAILSVAYLTSVAMVALGFLAMKGAAKDVLDVMDRLPPPPEKEGDHASVRTRAMADFDRLYLRRCVPGAMLAGGGAVFLLFAVFRSFWRGLL